VPGELVDLTAVTKVDQFESAFRAAAKPVFEYRRPVIATVLVITDLGDADAAAFTTQVSSSLAVLGTVEWKVARNSQYSTSEELLGLVERHRPDLICTYRHLQSQAWQWPHSLGTHLDVLTQVAPYPIMVFPHPGRGGAMPHALLNTDQVMAITTELTGDDRLVNFASRLTQPHGVLHLTHIEDGATFERYLEVISKIPSINTDDAREAIRAQLLKQPSNYIESCRAGLAAAGVPQVVEGIVAIGHRLSEYARLIAEHEIDLLVMNTKDDDQFAMHGLAYPLAVELRDIPLLML